MLDIFFAGVLQHFKRRIGIKFEGFGGENVFAGIDTLSDQCRSARRGDHKHNAFDFRITQKIFDVIAGRNIVPFGVSISFFGDPVAHFDNADEFLIFRIVEDLLLGQSCAEAESDQSQTDGGSGVAHFFILSNLTSSTWACA